MSIWPSFHQNFAIYNHMDPRLGSVEISIGSIDCFTLVEVGLGI